MRSYRSFLRGLGVRHAALILLLVTTSALAQQRLRWAPSRPLAPHSSSVPAAVAVDTVRLLGLMAAFQPDEDPYTVGTGAFDTSNISGQAIDPAPHDRAYFLTKMRFVENYFRRVSNGKLTVIGEMLPGEIVVSKKMAEYSQDKSPENSGLAKLSVEAWTKADSAFPAVDFSAYDAYVLFHAGVGKDINLVGIYGYDPAPYDVPSIFLGLEAFRASLDDPGFQGISVEGGTTMIQNTIILPETETRIIGTGSDADTLGVSINGLFAASIGSYLGLPDLFNTATGATGIGQHGLMDGASIFSYFGIFPPEPSAWEKVFLGWVDPIVVTGPVDTLSIPAVGLTATRDTIYKVPINETEYYLVENRIRDPLGDGQRLTVSRNGVSSIMVFPKDSLRYFSFESVRAVNGSVTDVEDPDWALIGYDGSGTEYVGGGVLIWHIDESKVVAGLSSNTVNADPDHRGVDLEEADGAQDIGQSYSSFTGGTGSELGNPLDCWYAENPASVYDNRFDRSSYPDTRSNAGATSIVSIHSFSARSPRMTFVVTLGIPELTPVPGFPKYISGPAGEAVPFDVDGDGLDEFFTSQSNVGSSGRSRILGWNAQGVSLLLAGDSTGRFADLNGASVGRPAFTKLGVSPQSYAAAATTDSVYLWPFSDSNADGLADAVWSRALPTSSTAWDVAFVDSVVIAYGATGTRAYTFSGSEMFTVTGPSTISALGEDVVMVSSGSTLHKFDLATGLAQATVTYSSPIVAMAGGLQEPGEDIHVALGADASIVVIDITAVTFTLESSFSVRPYLAAEDSLLPFIAVADVDQNGRKDIVVFTHHGSALAFTRSGALLSGYPLAGLESETRASAPNIIRTNNDAGATFASLDAAGVFRMTSTSGSELYQASESTVHSLASGRTVSGGTAYLTFFGVSDSGAVGLWRTDRAIDDAGLLWPSEKGSGNGGSYFHFLGGTTEPLASGILPADRTYNWPNPVYGSVTYIRYFCEQGGDVTVDIFDMSGDKVTQLKGVAQVGEDSEIAWDVTGIQAGMYLARVQATSGGATASAVIKIAVIR